MYTHTHTHTHIHTHTQAMTTNPDLIRNKYEEDDNGEEED
jgi:hypothetical protein